MYLQSSFSFMPCYLYKSIGQMEFLAHCHGRVRLTGHRYKGAMHATLSCSLHQTTTILYHQSTADLTADLKAHQTSSKCSSTSPTPLHC